MSLNKSLVEIGASGTCGDLDKGSDCTNPIQPGHTYLEVYDMLFKPYGIKDINLLEIGFQYGPSMRLFWEYFDKTSNIFGIDICDNCSVEKAYLNIKECAFPDPIEILTDEDFSNIYLSEIDSHHPEKFISGINDLGIKFDIIIDDGWHSVVSNILNFRNFISTLDNDGIYIVEDMGIDGDIKDVSIGIKDLGHELHIIDMSHKLKDDNILGLVYNPNGKHSKYFDKFIKSEIWKTDEKFSIEYSIVKQNKLIENGIKPWNPHMHPRNSPGSRYPFTNNDKSLIEIFHHDVDGEFYNTDKIKANHRSNK